MPEPDPTVAVVRAHADYLARLASTAPVLLDNIEQGEADGLKWVARDNAAHMRERARSILTAAALLYASAVELEGRYLERAVGG